MLTTNDVAEHYAYFYRQFYHSANYECKYTDKTLKVSQQFLSQFKTVYPHADTLNLWNYCVWQFDRWSKVEIQNAFSNRIMFEYIFGNKAWHKYLERDTSFDWVMQRSKIYKEYHLDRDHIRQYSLLKVAEGFDYEELLKKSFINSETGLFDCIDNDIYWKPDSPICDQCKYNDKCKIILKDNYPDIYKLRTKK